VRDNNIRRVGVIGLGKMGDPIARHLKRGGYEVSGFDVSEQAAQKGRANGIDVRPDPASVASDSDLVLVLTAYESQVEAVLFGADGVASTGRNGLVIGIGATIAPNSARRIAEQLASRGMVALDMPICRGEPAAEAGTLMLIGGGEKATFERCRAALATFADTIAYLGGPGTGQVGKMVNNLILWACISANHEGLGLGEALGVDREAMRDMLLQSSGANWALETRIADYPMPWAEKDMTIVAKEADDLRRSVPLCGVVKEVVKSIKVARGDW
jgi:3-hydroxyisobutyrate dehydrogenase-like beta-hydroxyacid dehydrogenase